MSRKYITDSIGDEYTKWDAWDTVFLSSPTGSGKTTFVLKTLLPYYSKYGMKILYLVNRSILKEQIESELEDIPFEVRKSIQVETYQTLEQLATNLCYQTDRYLTPYGSCNSLLQKYSEFNCVICDESHYFLSDSNYNTSTIFSYRFINQAFRAKIRIFMSATIDEIKEEVKDDNLLLGQTVTPWFNFPICNSFPYPFLGKTYYYSAERNYEYIHIEFFSDRDQVVDLVLESNSRWLIFVDNKKFGKDLKEKISKSNEVKVSFITSDYLADADAVEETESLAKKNKQHAKVLIATSVLDCGVSIHDPELRNIIIFADNETEFIQMLGRRRNNEESIKVFVFNYDKAHFTRRLNYVKRRYELAFKYFESASRIIDKQIKNNSESLKNPESFYQAINMICFWERLFINSEHKWLVKKMVNNEYGVAEYLRSVCTEWDGTLSLSPLSFQNLDNLKRYYKTIIGKFEKDGADAFLMEVMTWLRKSKEEIESAKSNVIERSKKRIIDYLEKEVGDSLDGRKLDKEEWIAFKNNIREDVLNVITLYPDADRRSKWGESLKKNDRPISKQLFEFLREELKLPYLLSQEKDCVLLKKSFIEQEEGDCKKIQEK